MKRLISSILIWIFIGGCGKHSDSLSVSSIISPSSASCTPRVVTVTLIGDSTMYGAQGSVLPRAIHNPGFELQGDMDARFGPGNVIVTDLGIPGTYSSEAPHVTADVIVANYGINDMPGAHLQRYSKNMKAIGATLIETQNPIVSIKYPFSIQAQYVAAASAIGVPVADTYNYVLSLRNWQSMLADGTHPLDSLYVKIVDNVLAPAVGKQVAPLRCQ